MKITANAFVCQVDDFASLARSPHEKDALAKALVRELEACRMRAAVTGIPTTSESAWPLLLHIAHANLQARAAGLAELEGATGIGRAQIRRYLSIMDNDGLVAMSWGDPAPAAALTSKCVRKLTEYLTLASQ
jgi:hypothetical protein